MRTTTLLDASSKAIGRIEETFGKQGERLRRDSSELNGTTPTLRFSKVYQRDKTGYLSSIATHRAHAAPEQWLQRLPNIKLSEKRAAELWQLAGSLHALQTDQALPQEWQDWRRQPAAWPDSKIFSNSSNRRDTGSWRSNAAWTAKGAAVASSNVKPSLPDKRMARKIRTGSST